VAEQRNCVTFVPDDAKRLYVFFRPELGSQECSGNPDSLVLAISPYDPDHAYESTRRDLTTRGLTQTSKQEFNGPRVELYAK